MPQLDLFIFSLLTNSIIIYLFLMKYILMLFVFIFFIFSQNLIFSNNIITIIYYYLDSSFNFFKSFSFFRFYLFNFSLIFFYSLMGFPEPGNFGMVKYIQMHNYMFSYLIVILVLVFYLLTIALYLGYVPLGHFTENTGNLKYTVYVNNFDHCVYIEVLWTIIPALILEHTGSIGIAYIFVSENPLGLHLFSNSKYPDTVIKVTGYQWAWHYDYSSFQDINGQTVKFDSYENSEELYSNPNNIGSVKYEKFLNVNEQLVLPVKSRLRALITSKDVIHSWAIPSLGIKMDAIPGRLNQVDFIIDKRGLFKGQCSEYCGLNHGMMPIVIKSCDLVDYWCFLVKKAANSNLLKFNINHSQKKITLGAYYDKFWSYYALWLFTTDSFNQNSDLSLISLIKHYRNVFRAFPSLFAPYSLPLSGYDFSIEEINRVFYLIKRDLNLLFTGDVFSKSSYKFFFSNNENSPVSKISNFAAYNCSFSDVVKLARFFRSFLKKVSFTLPNFTVFEERFLDSIYFKPALFYINSSLSSFKNIDDYLSINDKSDVWAPSNEDTKEPFLLRFISTIFYDKPNPIDDLHKFFSFNTDRSNYNNKNLKVMCTVWNEIIRYFLTVYPEFNSKEYIHLMSYNYQDFSNNYLVPMFWLGTFELKKSTNFYSCFFSNLLYSKISYIYILNIRKFGIHYKLDGYAQKVFESVLKRDLLFTLKLAQKSKMKCLRFICFTNDSLKIRNHIRSFSEKSEFFFNNYQKLNLKKMFSFKPLFKNLFLFDKYKK